MAAMLLPGTPRLTGFSNVVDLGGFGKIGRDDRAGDAHSLLFAPSASDLRWRGGALSRFDGRRWSEPPLAGALCRLTEAPRRSRILSAFAARRPPADLSRRFAEFRYRNAVYRRYPGVHQCRRTAAAADARGFAPRSGPAGETLRYEVSAHSGPPLAVATRPMPSDPLPGSSRRSTFAFGTSRTNGPEMARRWINRCVSSSICERTSSTRWMDPINRSRSAGRLPVCEERGLLRIFRFSYGGDDAHRGYSGSCCDRIPERLFQRCLGALCHTRIRCPRVGRRVDRRQGWTIFDPTPVEAMRTAQVFGPASICISMPRTMPGRSGLSPTHRATGRDGGEVRGGAARTLTARAQAMLRLDDRMPSRGRRSGAAGSRRAVTGGTGNLLWSPALAAMEERRAGTQDSAFGRHHPGRKRSLCVYARPARATWFSEASLVYSEIICTASSPARRKSA